MVVDMHANTDYAGTAWHVIVAELSPRIVSR